MSGGEPDSSRRRTQVLHQYPVGIPPTHVKLPADVWSAMAEAEKCLAVAAPNACGTMVRRAVDALAQHKKAKGKDLYGRLADLKNKGVITPDLYEWAEELRVAGRHGAHPEWEDLDMKK